MSDHDDRHPDRHVKRAYVSPLRAAGSAATRLTILRASKVEFETRGWTGTTLAGVAHVADLSPKTIQAQFGTKPKLLAATVEYAIRGDVSAQRVARRESAGAIRAAPDAPTALRLHAAMSTAINARAAQLAGVVEAAAGDPAVAPLWARMRENMRFGVDWAAGVIFEKPGHRADLTPSELRAALQIAMAWGTYRVLAVEAGLGAEEIRAWIEQFYWRTLLPPEA